MINSSLLCVDRFKSLQKPLDERRSQLEAAVALFGFYHDVDLELTWISDHHPVAETSGYSKSLAGAISLLKKHKVKDSTSVCDADAAKRA